MYLKQPFIYFPYKRSATIAAAISLLVVGALFRTEGILVRADSVIGNVTVGTGPSAVAVNPITNKIYVANAGSSTVSVVDGTNNATGTIPVGTNPSAIAINAATNKIYVTNRGNGTVTVIDGADNSAVTLSVGSSPGRSRSIR